MQNSCDLKIPALSGSDVTVLSMTLNSARITSAVFTANERIKAERLRQTNVTVGTGHTRWTNTLTSLWVTQPTGTMTACTQ